MVQGQVLALAKDAKKHGQRIKALIHKVEADDPVKQKAEEETLESVIRRLKEDPAVLAAVKKGEPLSVSLSGEAAEELDKEDLNRLFVSAVEKVRAEHSDA